LQQAVLAFFASNTSWLTAVLEEGVADGSLQFTGTVEDTAAMILGGLEGAMLVARLDGDVVRFAAAANSLLATITARPTPA
jgi:TetR/AcrR family transcriptional repressor of nem operon